MRKDDISLKAVFFDLDSTVADTRQRRALAPTVNPDSTWDLYSQACIKDAPMMGTILVLRAFAALGHSVHGVSGRSFSAFDDTVEWLGIHNVPYDSLRLKRDGDIEDNAQYKYAYVLDMKSKGWIPHLFLEDWPPVAKLLSVLVPVLTVNPLYTDDVMAVWDSKVGK